MIVETAMSWEREAAQAAGDRAHVPVAMQIAALRVAENFSANVADVLALSVEFLVFAEISHASASVIAVFAWEGSPVVARVHVSDEITLRSGLVITLSADQWQNRHCGNTSLFRRALCVREEKRDNENDRVSVK